MYANNIKESYSSVYPKILNIMHKGIDLSKTGSFKKQVQSLNNLNIFFFFGTVFARKIIDQLNE